MTRTPEEKARIERIGKASVAIIESMSAISKEYDLTPRQAVMAMTFAASAVGDAETMLSGMIALSEDKDE